MKDKIIFNEDIKRVFNYMTNSQIITQYLFKDYISDIKIINEVKKSEKNTENNSNYNNNSKSMSKYNDSSKNLMAINNLSGKASTSIHPIMTGNNSFLYLNSSFKSINLEKMEGIIIECKWKKKYILLLRIIKINSEQFHKSIDIECIEMNHFENAFNLEIRLYWDTSTLQTIVLLRFITKDKIIEEIINRAVNNNDKNIIYQNFNDYLINDLTNLENCATSLVFANSKEIALYLSDITKIIKFSPGMENKRFQKYTSSLLSSAQNCRVYDIKTNTLWQEYIFSGFYADKLRGCQIRWEKKENNKKYCIYRISITYLEDNLSLLIFKNIYQTHVTTQYLSDINFRKKKLFNEIREYFNNRNVQKEIENRFLKKYNGLKLEIAIKNYEDKNDENKNDLNMFIHNNSFIKNIDAKDQEKEDSQFNSLLQGQSYLDNNNGKENLFSDSIQNISEIENINSAFLFGQDDN